MWPLLVVFVKPRFSDLANLIERVEQVCVEHLVAIGFVEALDESILKLMDLTP